MKVSQKGIIYIWVTFSGLRSLSYVDGVEQRYVDSKDRFTAEAKGEVSQSKLKLGHPQATKQDKKFTLIQTEAGGTGDLFDKPEEQVIYLLSLCA